MYLSDTQIKARIRIFAEYRELFLNMIEHKLPVASWVKSGISKDIDIQQRSYLDNRRMNEHGFYEDFHGIYIDPIILGESFDPKYETVISGCSIDLTLGDEFKSLTHSRHTMGNKTVQPRETFLAITKQTVFIPPDLLGRLEGKSSLARQGLSVHITSSKIDPGFYGKIVLECHNYTDEEILIKPGQAVCALTFCQLTSPSETPYYMRESAQFNKQMTL